MVRQQRRFYRDMSLNVTTCHEISREVTIFHHIPWHKTRTRTITLNPNPNPASDTALMTLHSWCYLVVFRDIHDILMLCGISLLARDISLHFTRQVKCHEKPWYVCRLCV